MNENLRNLLPPIALEDLTDAFAFENVFDRVVLTRRGIYGRRQSNGIWIKVESLQAEPTQTAASK